MVGLGQNLAVGIEFLYPTDKAIAQAFSHKAFGLFFFSRVFKFGKN